MSRVPDFNITTILGHKRSSPTESAPNPKRLISSNSVPPGFCEFNFIYNPLLVQNFNSLGFLPPNFAVVGEDQSMDDGTASFFDKVDLEAEELDSDVMVSDVESEELMDLREAIAKFEGKTNPTTEKKYTDVEIGAKAGTPSGDGLQAQARKGLGKPTGTWEDALALVDKPIGDGSGKKHTQTSACAHYNLPNYAISHGLRAQRNVSKKS